MKVEKHLRMCGKGTFKIFHLLQMQSCEIDLRSCWKKEALLKKCKTKLKYL